MTTNLSIEQLQRATVIDQDGDKIGDVGQVYVDDATGAPSWVTVRTGLFGTKETFIPLDRAQNDADGLRVPYEKRFVKDAPNMAEDEHLSPEHEAELYRYYGLDTDTHTGGRQTGGTTTGPVTPHVTGDPSRTAGAPAEGGYTDVDGRRTAQHGEGEYTDINGNRALRHEEGEYTDVAGDRGTLDTEGEYTTADRDRPRAGTETREAGRLRLRKHIEPTMGTATVPVERKERIDVDESGTGRAGTGGNGRETDRY